MWVMVVFIVLLIILFYWFLNGTFSYWKNKNVPYPKPFPFVGNLGPTLFRGENPGLTYIKIYNHFKDYDWVGFYKFRNPAVIIRDTELIKNIIIKEFSSFHDNDIDVDEVKDPLFGKNPFSLKGQKWRSIRSKITPALTTGKIKNMFNFTTNVNKDLINYLNQQIKLNNNYGLNAKDLCTRYTTDLVAASAFGLEIKSFVDSSLELEKIRDKIFHLEGLDGFKSLLLFMFPSLSKFISTSFLAKNFKDSFNKIIRQAIKYREENKIVRNDYLDLLLSLKGKLGEYEFTDVDVVAQCLTIFGDGVETTGIAMRFVLFELSQHLDLQQKLREEIDEFLEKENGEISYGTIQNMPYLDMVVSESLRMHPPLLYLLKRCTKQFTLPAPAGEHTGPGIVINPNMALLIPIYAIHYDSKYYPNPEKFIPERFTEEEKQNRPKCAYIPFGEGPRQCLGNRFALMQIKAAVVAIVSNFQFKLSAKTSPIMEIDPDTVFLNKKGGIYLDFERRLI